MAAPVFPVSPIARQISICNYRLSETRIKNSRNILQEKFAHTI